MAGFSGTYSRRLYDENRRYLGVAQEASSGLGALARPWVDADWNDFVDMTVRHTQRIVQRGFGDGSPDDGFKIAEFVGASNDFDVLGGKGDPGIERAGRMWVGGLPVHLEDRIAYKVAGSASAEILHHRSTGLVATTLTDTAVRWVAGELVGRSLVPDATVPGTSYVITANTQTTITVAGDMIAGGAVAGAVYYVALSTPAVNRTDDVWLDVYVDEIDVTEDPSLDHGAAFGAGSQKVGANRLKVQANIVVNEGGKGHFVPAVPAGGDATLHRTWTDSNGEPHWMTKIATLARTAGTATIPAAQITDARTTNWGMASMRAGLVGPDHTAVDLKRRLDEVRTWITVGDGVATFGDYNGEAGLRAAVVAASALPGSGVWIKRGTYTLTAAVAVTNSVHIKGETYAGLALGVKVVKAAGAYAFNGTANGWSLQDVHVDCVDDPTAGIRATQSVRLERVRVDNIGSVGASVADAAVLSDCVLVSDQAAGGVEITAAAACDTVVERCTFSLTGADLTDYGVVVKGGALGAGIVVRDCRFTGGRGGVYVQGSSSSALRIVGCRFGAALADNGVRFDEGNLDPLVEGCDFQAGIGAGDILMDAIGAGVVSRPRLLGNFFGAPDAANPWVDLRKVQRAVVAGNVFHGARASDMLYVDAIGEAVTDPASLVQGNTFHGGGAATAAVSVGSNQKGTVVAGNVVQSTNSKGIYILSPECAVEGNKVYGIGGDGIVLGAAAHDCAIVGNHVFEMSSECVLTNGADRLVITGNRLSRNVGVGTRELTMTGSTKCVVTGNNMRQDDGSLGEIDLDSADNVVRDNGAVETLVRTSVIPVEAFHSLDPGLVGSLANREAADAHWLVNGPGLDFLRAALTPGHLPQGCLLQGFDVYVSATDATHILRCILKASSYADGTYTSVAAFNKAAAEAAIPDETQKSSNAVNTTIDWTVNGYVLSVDMDYNAAPGGHIHLYRARLRYKHAS